MLSIQLPYGYVNKPKQIRFDLPKNFEESYYFDKAPYQQIILQKLKIN